ncbi:MAG TPA: DNA cytosine methyltransferase [Phycisphaerae bacterium]|nr:DNA cytosine methyltransferase [Phycisphaerae bacterium]
MILYSDNDPDACDKMRALMADGWIPQGVIDDRSILDVRASDLDGFSECHFFAGAGLWAVALRLGGWPDGRPVWTGSCPCQPFSCAGKGRGAADERHLWPAWFRLIRECRPATVFGEQVEGAIRKDWLDGVCADLEGEGYACGSAVLPAACLESPHMRHRLYWLADAGEAECRWGSKAGWFATRRLEHATDPCVPFRLAEWRDAGWADYELCWCRDPMGGPPRPRRFGRGAFPLAARMAGRGAVLRVAGNGIVPQVAAAFVAAAGEVRETHGPA